MTTVARMATLTGLIPVTVGTFEAYHGGGGGGDTIGGGWGLGTQSAGPYMGFRVEGQVGFRAYGSVLWRSGFHPGVAKVFWS